MFRILAPLSLVALLVWSCDPESRTCSGAHPDFKVVLKLQTLPLPADTVVRVSYAGSGIEVFRLSDRYAPHEVTFCKVADENGVPLDPSALDPIGAAGAAGAAGADSGAASAAVAALYCELWTGGFAELKVSGSGFETVEYDLVPKEDRCVVAEPTYVLDAPDAG